jgi:hypothetical protein
LNPALEAVSLKVEKDGAEVYHPSAVLDLDYWALVPRRRA